MTSPMRVIVNAVLIRDGQVLLARRSAHRKAYPNCWSFPGGHREAGETDEQALVRELTEEIGVLPLDYRLLSHLPDPHAPADVVYHVYAVTEWQGDPAILDDEHSILSWFDVSEAARLNDLALASYQDIFVLL